MPCPRSWLLLFSQPRLPRDRTQLPRSRNRQDDSGWDRRFLTCITTENRASVPPEPHNPHPDEVVTPMSAMFPVRAPGPGDVLPHAEAGLGQRYRAGMDVTGSMAAQMSDGTDPELVSTNAWLRSRYAKPKTTFPAWRQDRDHGEVPGTNRYFRSEAEFIEAFDITGLDHIGHVGGRHLTPIMNGGIFPSEFRSGPPANFNELYHQFRFTGNALPEDVMIEICLLDEDHGSYGYAPQVRILEKVALGAWVAMTIDELITQNIIEGVSEHVGEVRDVDWEALFGYFRRTK